MGRVTKRNQGVTMTLKEAQSIGTGTLITFEDTGELIAMDYEVAISLIYEDFDKVETKYKKKIKNLKAKLKNAEQTIAKLSDTTTSK